MVQSFEAVDRRIARNLLEEMAVAGVTLDSLVRETGISEKVLKHRIAAGSFRVGELAKIAAALDQDLSYLVREVA